MNKHTLLIAALACLSSLAQAQTTPISAASRIQQRTLSKDSIPTEIAFWKDKAYKEVEAHQALREQLDLLPNERMVKVDSIVDNIGFAHTKYQLYYSGYKVESAIYTVHARQGTIVSMNGRLQRRGQIVLSPSLSAADALNRALNFVGASQYMWQDTKEEAGLKQRQNRASATYLPAGELVIVSNSLNNLSDKQNRFALAWKFDIFARQPFSRQYVFVDAQTGQIISVEPVMKDVVGQFDTRYSGRQSVETQAAPTGGYRLRDYSRGNGIETYNSQRTATVGGAADFIDNDNNWTSTEYNNPSFDNAAGDAHLGAEATFDYLKNFLGRNSYDNSGSVIRSYVHFTPDPVRFPTWPNARWTGSEMVYGDGDATYRPLTSLDVCAHEIGHGVCSTSANLAYQSESGALNEGFSDIWGACVEQYTTSRLGLTKSTWLIGEEIAKFAPAVRSMSDPRSLGQPAYYGGQIWIADPGVYNSGNDYGGVHTNSGVLNHWFYILSQGKSGVNEGGKTYAVTGIGISKAANIAYRAESVYLTSASRFSDARALTIRAAIDLYGGCSAEAQATSAAWNAVGVYGADVPSGPLTVEAVSADESNFCRVGIITFSPYYAGGIPVSTFGATYLWTLTGSGANIKFGGNRSEQITLNLRGSSGSFGLNLTVTNACGTTNFSTGTIYNSYYYNNCQSSFTLYPNPANAQVTVSKTNATAAPPTATASITLAADTDYSIKVYDHLGNLVKSGLMKVGALQLLTADLPNGLYSVHAIHDKEHFQKQLRIQHE